MIETFCLVLAAYLGIIIWFWLKGKPDTIKKLPIKFGALHFIFVATFSIIILIWTQYDEEAGVLWRVFYYLDWPTSIIFKSEWIWKIWTPIFKLPIIRTIPHAIISNVVFPFINFSILGTIQYYIWGLIISKILLLRKR